MWIFQHIDDLSEHIFICQNEYLIYVLEIKLWERNTKIRKFREEITKVSGWDNTCWVEGRTWKSVFVLQEGLEQIQGSAPFSLSKSWAESMNWGGKSLREMKTRVPLIAISDRSIDHQRLRSFPFSPSSSSSSSSSKCQRSRAEMFWNCVFPYYSFCHVV